MVDGFEVRTVFSLDEGFGNRLNVLMPFEEESGKILSVSFSDPDRSEMISVPGDLWDRILAVVERNKEF